MRVPAAEFLLVDNSNSFTKFALSSRDALLRKRKLPTRDVDRDSLQRILRGWRFQCAVLSSVVPKKGDLIALFLSGIPIVRVSSRLELGVGVDYPKPKTIGADRLANAASAVAFYGAPVVVVDFGTAVSFDVVSREKSYVGGVIAPGLEAMTEYLHHRTALLPKIRLAEPASAIGRSTRNAMLAGAVYGYRGLVRQILTEISRELGPGKRAKVIATGGYAELIAAGLPEIDRVREDLTLEGLRLIGALNYSPGANSRKRMRPRR
jgi:type III pantothenate kinase